MYAEADATADRIALTVVTPTYRRSTQLFVLSQHVLQQGRHIDLRRVEWLIIDDSAHDEPASAAEDQRARWTAHALPPPLGAAGAALGAARLVVVDRRVSIGWKRNLGKAIARGNCIVHMDDDDYYAPWYLAYLRRAYAAQPAVDVIGATTTFVRIPGAARLHRSGPFRHTHSCGGALSYRKRYAAAHHFEESVRFGEEPAFLRGIRPWQMQQIPRSYEHFVVISHAGCTVPKHGAASRVRLHPCAALRWSDALPVRHDLWYLVRAASSLCEDEHEPLDEDRGVVDPRREDRRRAHRARARLMRAFALHVMCRCLLANNVDGDDEAGDNDDADAAMRTAPAEWASRQYAAYGARVFASDPSASSEPASDGAHCAQGAGECVRLTEETGAPCAN